MILDTNLITINSISVAQYLTEARFDYNKLWGSDTGRNLAGTMTGTLLGIFPKITLTFRKLTKSELEIIAPILDSAYQTLVYYDPNKKANVTLTTYSSDWSVINKQTIDENKKNEGFTCSFISTKKRS